MNAGRPFPTARRLFGLLLLSASALVSGQSAPPPAEPEAPQEAVLQVFNRDVAVFRGKLLGVTPAQRAERGAQRIDAHLAEYPDAKVSLEQNPLGTIFKLDDEMVFLLTPGDADRLQQQSLAAAAEETRVRLQRAVAESRESRNTGKLLRGLGVSVLATLALAALLWLFGRLRRAIGRRLARMTENARLELNGMPLLPRTPVLRALLSVNRLFHAAVVAFLLYEWLSLCLAQFPYTRPWSEGLNGFLFGMASTFGAAVLRAIPELLTAAAIFLLAYWLTRLSKAFFAQIENGRARFGLLDAELARPTRKLVAAVIWLFALVMAYPYLPGSDSEAFKGMSVLVGLMLSLGASNIVSQGASGLILTYSKTMRAGEYVRIGEHEGTVIDLGMFNTRLRTGMGEEVTLANSTVFSSVTRNYSRTASGQGYILDTVLTIGYDTPWRQVEAMLLEAARRTEGIADSPPPRVFQTALSDFYPEYRLVCQALPELPKPRAIALSDLHANIQDVFNRYGVQIMSPHYVLDPASEKTVPDERKYTAPAHPPE